MKIHIIAAALPPKLDGIGDYTALLSAELAKTVTVKVLTGRGQTPDPIPGVEIIPAFSVGNPKSVRDLLPLIKADRPDWVLLQYNPFSYGRWGRNLDLPEVMHQIKRVSPGTRVAVMVHEMFVPLSTWQFAIMRSWQCWQLWRIGQAADVLFCSIQVWTEKLQRWLPGKPVHHLPVASNIPLVPISRKDARARLGIDCATCVLGVFGSMHPSRMLSWVKNAAEAVCETGQEVLVLYIGPNGQVMHDSLGDIPHIADGPFPVEEVSMRLQAVDIYLVPFIDGISTRRTSLMTGLQHGLPTVGTSGPLSDDLLLRENGSAFLLAQATDPNHFSSHIMAINKDAARRTALAAAGQGVYLNEFGWDRMARQIVDKFRSVTGSR